MDLSDEFEKVRGPLTAFALTLTKNTEDAQDLMQETAVKVVTNADKFREGTNFKAWAITIMRNTFINQYRKDKSRKKILDGTPDNYYLNSGGQTVSNDGPGNLGFEELKSIVKSVDEIYRKPFLMHYEGHQYQEIADKLGIKIGTVKSRIFLARKQLKAKIEGTRNTGLDGQNLTFEK